MVSVDKGVPLKVDEDQAVARQLLASLQKRQKTISRTERSCIASGLGETSVHQREIKHLPKQESCCESESHNDWLGSQEYSCTPELMNHITCR